MNKNHKFHVLECTEKDFLFLAVFGDEVRVSDMYIKGVSESKLEAVLNCRKNKRLFKKVNVNIVYHREHL